MSNYHQQQKQQQLYVSHMGPPPALPAHYEHMSPSPTPTVNLNQMNEPYRPFQKYGEIQGSKRN